MKDEHAAAVNVKRSTSSTTNTSRSTANIQARSSWWVEGGVMSIRFVLVLAALVGCTEGLRGVPMKAPHTTGKIVASATTSDREGLRVLWNGRTGGMETKRKAWIAGSDEE